MSRFVFVAIVIFAIASNAARLKQKHSQVGKGNATTSLSLTQSFGFIDETDDKWNLRKQIHLTQMAKEEKIGNLFNEQKGRIWWQYHAEPSFHCEFAQRVGNAGDGGKWVCDPTALAKQVKEGAPCLVYSVGSNGQFDFEQSMQDTISKSCEVHIFDPSPNYAAKTPENMFYHAYPLGNGKDVVMGVHSKALPEVVKELGHTGRKIDVFKIDCEGCEWDTYKDWIQSGVDIHQIQVELHWRDDAAKVQEFYKFLGDQGYVIFSKESNTEGCGGDCIEYSFLKLDPSFTQKESS